MEVALIKMGKFEGRADLKGESKVIQWNMKLKAWVRHPNIRFQKGVCSKMCKSGVRARDTCGHLQPIPNMRSHGKHESTKEQNIEEI